MNTIRDHDEGRAVLLILDGHKSHTSDEFMEECFFGNVYLCFLPAHTSHGLQPADNGHFNVLKAAYRKEIDKLDSITDSAPIGKINFLRCLAKARKAVSEKTIKAAWRHTSNWPVSRQKALNHPDCKPDREKRGVDAAELEPEDNPVDRQFIITMSKENPQQRYKFRRLAEELDTLQAKIVFLEQEKAELRAREEAQVGTKKRKAIPNPNKKFMSIHDILSKGGCVEDMEEGITPIDQQEEPADTIVVEEEEDIYGVSDAEQEADIEEDVPVEVRTRSGRAVRKPNIP